VHNINRQIQGATYPAGADLSGSWRAIWDNTNLYVFVDVQDGQRFLDSGVNYWDDDGIEIYIDSNNDGVDDFVVFNQESGAFGTTGQTLVYVVNLASNAVGAFFYLDADLQSANGIFTVPMSEVGLTAGSKFRFSVYAYDNYFTGANTDAIENMTYTLGSPRYVASGGVVAGDLAPNEKRKLRVDAVAGGDVASPSQSGFLLLYRQNKGEETDVVTVKR
jgi:hypothetical protein